MRSSLDQAGVHIAEPASADGIGGSSCTGVQHEQPTVSMFPIVLPMVARVKDLDPCTLQMPNQPTIQAPPADFSHSMGYVGSDRDELLEQQRLLKEQHRRFMSMSNSCGSISGWKTPSVRHHVNSGFDHQEAKHQRLHQRTQTEIKPHERTTVILRNLPEGFSRDMIAELLSSQGLAKNFDFIYAPVRFGTVSTIGYAFVNFTSPEAAEVCHSKFEGFTSWGKVCENVMSVVWSDSDQGLAAIIDRHRNSPVMHESVQEKFKPAIYKDGVRCAFPRPTRRIRPPRTQRYKNEFAGENGGEQL